MSILRKFVVLMRRRRHEADMAEEIRLHLEQRQEENRARGLSAADAHYAALRRFGGVEQVKEVAREQRGWRWLDGARQDGRFALRMVSRQPGFSLAAVLTLALGIGFVTTLFTIINGVAFRDLPVPDAPRVVGVTMPNAHFSAAALQQTSFERLSQVVTSAVNLGIGETAIRRSAAQVSINFLDTLQLRPQVGRGFFPAESVPGATKVVIVSHRIWQEEFAGARDVLERVVRINGEPHVVIGVMPEGFAFPRHEDLWRPLPDEPDAANSAETFGRLKAGVSAAQAAAELTAILARLGPAPGTSAVEAVEVTRFAARGIKGKVRNVLFALLGATFLVLVLACANVANLFLARACERSRELAVRAAVGATRGRLLGQLMTESVVLSALGAAVGIGMASTAMRFVWRYIEGEREVTGGAPYWINFEMDGRVLAFVTSVTVLAAVLSGLVPALRASRVDVNERLKAGGGGTVRRSRLMALLVNVQIALSVALVTAAGLFFTILVQARHKILPYNPTSVLTARLAIDEKTHPDPQRRAVMQTALADSLRVQPGVEAVAFSTANSLRLNVRRIQLEGETYARPGDAPWCGGEAVSTDFFAALGLRVLMGRGFETTDRADTSLVAVVTPSFAERFSPGVSVLGRRFRLGSNGVNARWITVVGVVSDPGSVKAGRENDGPRWYRPLVQAPASDVTLIVRARGESAALAETVRRAVSAMDRDLPVASLLTGQRILEIERIGINLPATLFIFCGMAALALASVGVYGVVSLAVKNRTREFGVRLALGATPRAIVRLVVGEGFRDLALGLGAGAVLAIGAAAMMRSIFLGFGRAGTDAGVYCGVVILLGGVAALALFLPARRASRTNPMTALRSE